MSDRTDFSDSAAPTIYIDCTHTYATEVYTGIQRVVRQVVHEARHNAFADIPYRVQPVVIFEDRFYPVDSLPQHDYQRTTQETGRRRPFFARLRRLPQYPAHLLRKWVKGMLRSETLEPVKSRFREHFPGLYAALKKRFLKMNLSAKDRALLSSAPVSFRKHDILFALDSNWHMDVWPALESAAAQQATIIFCVYDLIPVTHPQFCDEVLVPFFTNYFHRSLELADGFIAISRAVQKDVERYIEHNGLLPVGRSIIIDHFHLGADFSPPEAGSVRASLQEVFGEEPVYLIVSTIEPRKNHVYLIDAFDRLWDRGVRVRLLIVGRVGWKVDALMQRLRTHPLRDKALFLFHDLSDAELAHAYRHAKALVFPSHVEGFGLPIIEAMQHGLPVIVSDIPVHREVAGERACFVSLDDTQSLVDCIESIETNGMPDTCRPDADFHWLTWRESTHQLLRKIVRIGEQARQRA